jgi:hypothetical protein
MVVLLLQVPMLLRGWRDLGGCIVLNLYESNECTGGVLIWTLPYYVYIQ